MCGVLKKCFQKSNNNQLFLEENELFIIKKAFSGIYLANEAKNDGKKKKNAKKTIILSKDNRYQAQS